MERQDVPAGSPNRLGEVKILLISRKPVKAMGGSAVTAADGDCAMTGIAVRMAAKKIDVGAAQGQDGTLALNFLARAASVVSHWISRSVPVRNQSIHSGGSTEKSIVWRPQSGRRPS